jgi:hypothetical protein
MSFARACSILILTLAINLTATAEEPDRKRLLLLVQGPDGHPAGTHEYIAGMEIIAKTLQDRADLETITVHADEPWSDGPKQLAAADGAVLYLAEGAKWLQVNAERQEAFEQLAARGGALSCLHWAMGTRDAQYIDAFVRLFGACHGGPDRKFQVLETTLTPASEGFAAKQLPFVIDDEFYYSLKFAKNSPVTPLWQAMIDGHSETVAWTWQRPDGGRSFGFSGAHFHHNWERDEYRTLVRDGILWSMSLEE